KSNKPNVVMSSIGHVNILMGIFTFFFKNTKFITREASVSGKRKNSNSLKNLLFKSSAKFLYPKLNKIVCQSIDMKVDLIENYELSAEKVIIINNPITITQTDSATK